MTAKTNQKSGNCQGDHVAISRDCPKWEIEKDIVTFKYTEKISFTDARKRLQPSFDPSKDSYATVTQTPPQSWRPLPPWAKKIRLPIDFKTEIEYLKYILNYCLTRLDTLNEIASDNPDPRNAPSSDETPLPTQTTPEQKKWNHNPEYWVRSTICSFKGWWKWNLNAYNEKRAIHEVRSEEEPTSSLPTKRTAPGPLASWQDGTFVPTGAWRGGPSKNSTFCPNPPRSGGQGSSGKDRSPWRYITFCATKTRQSK